MKFFQLILMKFIFLFHKNSFHIAVEIGKLEIVNLLLENEKINVNKISNLKNLKYNLAFHYYKISEDSKNQI